MNELDIPCSDCGTALVERTADPHALPVSTAWTGRVTLAVCPSCGARYYPKQALARLTGSQDFRPRGDS